MASYLSLIECIFSHHYMKRCTCIQYPACCSIGFFADERRGGWLSRSFSGIAIGTVVAVPMGSYLGGLYGWRCAFASLLPMAFASPSPRCTFEPICQIASIPSVIRKSHSLTMTP